MALSANIVRVKMTVLVPFPSKNPYCSSEISVLVFAFALLVIILKMTSIICQIKLKVLWILRSVVLGFFGGDIKADSQSPCLVWIQFHISCLQMMLIRQCQKLSKPLSFLFLDISLFIYNNNSNNLRFANRWPFSWFWEGCLLSAIGKQFLNVFLPPFSDFFFFFEYHLLPWRNCCRFSIS